MSRWLARQVACPALLVLAFGAPDVLAHALPGSVLVLQQQGAELQFTIQFPLEDLIIAAPDLAALQELKPDQPLPQALAVRFAAYLRQHFSVSEEGVERVPVLSGARIQSAYHDHLGRYLLLVSRWQLVTAQSPPGRLSLHYDAVMHEVRNHRATVQRLLPDGKVRTIAEFGFYGAADGVALSRSGKE
ncbi:hypothetical protein Q4485_14690 [Granulosicoccaceae sp. 1_MG-2023]|nr:hypothetical protein [Granulosicoccaceae sp. 1_MG-2023]